jgi:hypothetical protein
VDSCGVRISMNEADSGLYGDVDLVLAALRTGPVGLGLRHVREQIVLPSLDAVRASRQQSSWARIAELGIDFTCVIGAVDDSDGTVQEFADHIRDALGGNDGMVAAVENGNEPNDPSEPWNAADPEGWVSLCRTRQQQMGSVFRSDPMLDQIMLAGPSLTGGAGVVKYEALGDLAPDIDLGNFHYYPGSRRQSMPSVELDSIVASVGTNAPGLPVVCTETGMTNATNGAGAMASTPEAVAGVYLPRLPLDHLSRGVSRVFYFELLDDHLNPSGTNPNDHFGLLRYNTQLEPKPAYVAFKRLLDLLRDPGPAFDAVGLELRVSDVPDAYRQLLFQKADGRRYLCMWRDVSVWDQVSNQSVEVDPVDVTVETSSDFSVAVYQPDRQTAPLGRYDRVRTVTVPLAGHVKVLEFTA